MTHHAFEIALQQLRTALVSAPQNLTQANHAVRTQLEALRRRPGALSTEQLQQHHRQLQELAELARLRQHRARRLRNALTPDETTTGYGRLGLLR